MFRFFLGKRPMVNNSRLFKPNFTRLKNTVVEESSNASESAKNDGNVIPSSWGKYLFGGLLGASALTYAYLGAARDEDEDKSTSFEAHHQRFQKRFDGLKNEYIEPRSKKLLPDPLPDQPERLTLVINLEKFLIYQVYDEARGLWRNFLRPDAEAFLYNMTYFYEIVVYSSMPADLGFMHLENIDPLHNLITYRLFRDSTKYKDGHYVKDIEWLNRDLSRVVYVDCDETAPNLHPENTIKISPWKAEKTEESSLGNLMGFLETLALSSPKDVRPILGSYENGDILRIYADQEKKRYEETLDQRKASFEMRKSAHVLKSVLGLSKGSQQVSPATASALDSLDHVPSFEEYQKVKHEHRTKVMTQMKTLVEEELKLHRRLEKEYNEKYPFDMFSIFSMMTGSVPEDRPSYEEFCMKRVKEIQAEKQDETSSAIVNHQ